MFCMRSNGFSGRSGFSHVNVAAYVIYGKPLSFFISPYTRWWSVLVLGFGIGFSFMVDRMVKAFLADRLH